MEFPCIIFLFVFCFLKEFLASVVQLEVHLGDTVTLGCNFLYHYEITWMRHKPNQLPTVVLVAKLEDKKIVLIHQQDPRFTGVISNQSIALMIEGITDFDYGFYYCAYKDARILEIGQGTRLLDPGSGKQTVPKDCGDCEKVLAADHRGSPTSLFRLLYATVQGCGLLGMICAVATVHLMSWRRGSA